MTPSPKTYSTASSGSLTFVMEDGGTDRTGDTECVCSNAAKAERIARLLNEDERRAAVEAVAATVANA